ncbi:mitochondrial inner membrane protease ATP23 homolog [Littorina saxatilis]|uniref:Mitochondrial inner membrane protease ATP23 n=1 Tax=Littorina saxatilis TaxID=31220 RepID=A0AAN9GBQ1_9CAEN
MASKEPHEKADDGDLTSAPRQKFQRTEEEDYGYYFYPQRSGSEEVKSFWRSLWGRTGADNFRCEANVVWCMENNPMVKLLSRALKSHGCEVNLRRHISCENCLEKVNGGFDPTTNQVVICQNNVKKRNTCCNVLAHEFIHAFDSCRAKVDFEDLHHLACTEIRAANLMHCSFLTAVAAGDASSINIKQRHAQCVKSKALQSVLMVRNVPIEKAMVIVDSVFDKCYNDLEPVGRRPRKNSRDPERALLEGQYYGYS